MTSLPALPALPSLPVAKTCAVDKDCPDAMGCCAMVDPGSATADQLKFAGLPGTKSKVCMSSVIKASLDGQRTLKVPE